MSTDVEAATSAGGRQNKNRRRRRQSSITIQGTTTNNATTSPLMQGRKSTANINNNDNSKKVGYPNDDDNDDYSDDEKGHRSSKGEEHKIYRESCSLGRFVLNPCMCMFQSAISCWRRWRFRRKSILGGRTRSSATMNDNDRAWDGSSSIVLTILTLFLLLLLTAIALFSQVESFYTFQWSHSLRPVTDANVDQIAIRIPRLDYDKADIGGWKFFRRFFLPASPLDDVDFESSFVPDYDGINFNFSSSVLGKAREIDPNDNIIAQLEWNQRQYKVPIHLIYPEPAEALEDEVAKCRRPSFKLRYYPVCNAVHEVSLDRDYNPDRAADPLLGDDGFFDSFYINHGYYRDVWVLHQPDIDVKSIFKTTRWEHDFDQFIYLTVLNDALVMERLSKSPRIVDIYGHCGTTVWVEPVPFEIQEVVVPGTGYIDPKDLHDEEDVHPMNDFTVDEKLAMALEMAESLADLHGYSEGVIVHDDVQLCQWLGGKDGKLKLGDFNRAEIMDYNPVRKEYCKYNNGKVFGNYRAPEEFAAKYLDEQIDVFSFGSNIYALLTGLWVFYDNDNDVQVQRMVIQRKLPYIDPRWRTRSYVEGKLVEIMEKCWKYTPTQRIDIFEAVRLLREVSIENQRRKEEEKLQQAQVEGQAVAAAKTG